MPTPLRLVFSNSKKKTNVCASRSRRLKTSRTSSFKLPKLARLAAELALRDPDAAQVFERLINNALRRAAVNQ